MLTEIHKNAHSGSNLKVFGKVVMRGSTQIGFRIGLVFC